MSRPAKATVEYFSHKCRHGRVLFVMESLWGNDGYAFFYKIYELLGDSEGHVFDLNKVGNREYLLTYTRLNGVSVDEMLTKLSDLGIIDADLLKCGLIWSQCFVDDLDSVYSRRNITKPNKPSNADYCIQKPDSISNSPISADTNPQSIVNESKDINTLVRSPASDPETDIIIEVKKNGCPHQEIIKLYHEILPALPQVRVWTPKRQKMLKARWLSSKEYQDLEWWRQFFEFVRDRCPHLTGKNDRQWTADLEWLCTESNFVKTLEGRYNK